MMRVRIGIDLGGTKIEGVALDSQGRILAKLRQPTPRENYDGTVDAIAAVVRGVEAALPDAVRNALQETPTVGIGIPGSPSPRTGLIRNGNSTWLNGQPLQRDVETRLGRPVRLANDANCLAVSEATDGAGRDAKVVFAVILGTGVGGGIAIGKQLLEGHNAIGGEWGHMPLPWITEAEFPGPRCWCGRLGCIETWLAGPSLSADHARRTGRHMTAPEITAAADAGDAEAVASMERYEDRLARAFASIMNVLDPDIFVLGGGMSNCQRLYANVPKLLPRYAFSDFVDTPIVQAAHGDSSGVRGAAWLWPQTAEETAAERQRDEAALSDASGFCRDCDHPLPAVAAAERAKRCPACRSPRLLYHAELHELQIGHIDCDAFYAAIEKRDDPSLRDKPLIIGGGHRGVVSTCCYIARMSGVRSAMPMFKARKLCPEATILPPNMAKYRAVGLQVREMMQRLTPLVEPLSIDEAFLDLSGTTQLHRRSPARSLADLAKRIEQEIGITVSIGLSYNKFLAKIASDLDKPRGFSVIGRAEAAAFLASKPVSLIWGIGKVATAQLAKDGITMIGQLQEMDMEDLAKRYGQMGLRLFHLARGEDARAVEIDAPAKSISAETTFDEDIADFAVLAHELWPLCEKVSARLKSAGLAGQVVHLKLKTAGFRTISRQISLSAPTCLAETLYRAGRQLLERECNGTWYRLIGIGAGSFHPLTEADPLDLADPDADRRRKLEAAIDAVRTKLGKDSIVKGRSLPRIKRE
jgi:DNA polymerase-4